MKKSGSKETLTLSSGLHTRTVRITSKHVSWQLPGWNCLKHRERYSARIRFAGERECRAILHMAKAVSIDEFGYVCRWNSTVYRQQHGSRDWNANRDGPSTISDVPISITCEVGHIRVEGLAHGVIVAMTPVITSRRSQGPLDHDGHLQREVDGVLPVWLSSSGCTDGPQSVGHKTSAVQSFQFSGVYDEMCSKPQGKAAHERHGLKPYSRNETVRDFRGLDGNGNVDVFLPDMSERHSGCISEMHQYGIHRAIDLLGIKMETDRFFFTPF